MDFEKTSISTKVTKFLQENLKDVKDKESLQNIITEKALLKNDAINLLITILQALTIPDSTDEEEITVGNPIEEPTVIGEPLPGGLLRGGLDLLAGVGSLLRGGVSTT